MSFKGWKYFGNVCHSELCPSLETFVNLNNSRGFIKPTQILLLNTAIALSSGKWCFGNRTTRSYLFGLLCGPKLQHHDFFDQLGLTNPLRSEGG